MEPMNLVYLLVGFILGMILTAVGYHKWFTEYNEVIDDLKNQVKDKRMVIRALQNREREQETMFKEPKDGQEA